MFEVKVNWQHEVIGLANISVKRREGKKQAVEAVEVLEAETKKVGLRINRDKTEYLYMLQHTQALVEQSKCTKV